MSRVILFVPSTDDASTPRVARALADRGARAFVFPVDRFPSPAVQVGVRLPGGTRLSVDGRVIEVEEADALWVRRGGVGAAAVAALEPSMRAVTLEEANRTFQGMLHVAPGFVLDPLDAVRAASKLRQLALAPRVGLEAPATFVGSDPEQARAFVAAHPGGVVAKMLHDATVREGSARATVYTNRVGPDDVEALDALRFCPMQLQALVEREVEVRAIAVGDRVWAAALRTAPGQIDWRRTGVADLDRWQPWALPGEVERGIVQMQRALGLNYGAYDFIVTPEGRHVFLEVNPHGEWFWLADGPGFPIAEHLADVLLGRAPRV